jgi:uncharacterized membrane protein YfcA
VLGDTLRWPELCACCLKPPTGAVIQQASRTQNYLVVKATSTLGLQVPYCDDCARHVRWNEGTPLWVKAFVLFLVSGLLGLLLGLYFIAFEPPRPVLGYLALASPLIVTGLYVWRKLRERPPSPLGDEHASARAAVHIGSFGKGETQLLVLNDAFADALAAVNDCQIIDG